MWQASWPQRYHNPFDQHQEWQPLTGPDFLSMRNQSYLSGLTIQLSPRIAQFWCWTNPKLQGWNPLWWPKRSQPRQMKRYSLVNDWLCGGVSHSTVPWEHTCPGLNFAISISLCTGLISCGPYCKRMKQDGYEMNKQQMRSIVISNKLFYSCIFSYLPCECK